MSPTISKGESIKLSIYSRQESKCTTKPIFCKKSSRKCLIKEPKQKIFSYAIKFLDGIQEEKTKENMASLISFGEDPLLFKQCKAITHIF